jgi:hypothetical protein
LECGDLSPLCFRCDLSQRVLAAAASSRREEKAVTGHRTPKELPHVSHAWPRFFIEVFFGAGFVSAADDFFNPR